MTIKNTFKNVSAEDGDIVIRVTSSTPTTNNNDNANFTADQRLTITSFDFYEEGNEPTYNYIDIPLSQLVRLKYLQDNYWDKDHSYSRDEIDAHIKLHYKVLSTSEAQTVLAMTKKQWAQSVREANQTNYIFFECSIQ